MKHRQQKLFSEIEVSTHSLSHDGRGIATINGKTVFIQGALSEEKVKCKITQQHRRYNEGIATEIIQASPDRVTPPCQYYDSCGGCSMQHISPNQQIQFKQQALLEQLKHFGKVVPENILPPISGKEWGYRRKARLGVRYIQKKGKLLVGFRENTSNYLANIEECLVLCPSIGARIIEFSQLIASLNQHAHITQIEVAVGDDTAALIFRHLTPLPAEDTAKLCKFGELTALHIYVQPNSPAPIKKLWPPNDIERLTYALPDYDLSMQFHPLDFIQVNAEINRLLINQALQLLAIEPADCILDLFCGLGNFTLPMARHAKHVTGIEGNATMIQRAKENAQNNLIANTKFYIGNLAQPIESAPWMQQQYDKILLDPPRQGAKEIMALCSKFSAKKIIYISCNPASLARDAGELVCNQGYRLTQVGVINMFPHTSHIEAIALFEV
jgi:23S rRNA (uracil1939-C5)-methyltransferase